MQIVYSILNVNFQHAAKVKGTQRVEVVYLGLTAEQLAGPLLGMVDEASVLVPLLQQPGSTHHHAPVHRGHGTGRGLRSRQAVYSRVYKAGKQ